MKRHSKLASVAFGLAAVALTAGCNATAENPDYAKCMARTPAPEPGYCAGMFPPRPARGVDGITAWIDQHMPLLIGLGVAVIVIAVWSSIAKANAKEKAQRESATVARGRQIAEAAYGEKVADARAASPQPDPAEYDPLGMGLRPPTTEFTMPPRSVETPADLKRYATFQWAVPWKPGTAFGNLVGRDGDTSRVHSAWAEACQLAGLGETDPETGAFTPAASVVNVNGFATERGVNGPIENGDVSVAVDPRDYTVGDAQLERVRVHLRRTARVETVSPFERDAARDWFITVLSMDKAKAPAPAAEAPVDSDDDWRW
ncbi:hypothetical protein [Mycobacterium sp. D16Q16]|uniref:hypothetical protein n=1 Tax=Mycobacterium sp. D16Q16 TaxID=1855659 RepID=UPI00099317FF|nr:hypothetical protein [Mycobacterium sp. D16Q16]